MAYPYQFSGGAAARTCCTEVRTQFSAPFLRVDLHGSGAFQRPAIANINRKTMGFARAGSFGAGLARYAPAKNNE
jgi:hypothetical protein